MRSTKLETSLTKLIFLRLGIIPLFAIRVIINFTIVVFVVVVDVVVIIFIFLVLFDIFMRLFFITF